MSPVAGVEGLEVHAPTNSFMSLFNSPYYSHRRGSAVDIYLNTREYDFAPSPFKGLVKKIYEYKPPNPRSFPVQDVEHLIIMKPIHQYHLYARLLHIDPSVKVGDSVSVGDDLGLLVRSGFFNFWTDPHIHIDVRRSGNLVRAKGSLPLHPYQSGEEDSDPGCRSFGRFKALAVNDNYALLKARKSLKIGRFWGLKCTVGDDEGVLDGGIPHYSHGGVYLPSYHSARVGDTVKLGGSLIGTVERLEERTAFFRVEPLSVYTNDHLVKGLSLYLHLSDQKTVKVVPQEPAKLPFRAGESVEVSLTPRLLTEVTSE